MADKVIMIGLDGATWDVLDSLAEGGELPNLTKIRDGGAHGVLESVIPPITPSAWTSFMTGVNPGKHGIFGFGKRPDNAYSMAWCNYSDIRSPTFQKILSSENKRVVMVDVPFTYPPEKVNGIVISGMGTPSVESEFTHPKEMREEVLNRFDNYLLDVENISGESEKEIMVFLDQVFELTRQREKLGLFLIDEHPWDFFMLAFVGMDRIQHSLWKILDKEHPAYRKEYVKYRPRIVDYYRYVDSIIGRFLEKVGDDDVLMIMSDHGFGPLHRGFYVNRWLYEKGFLKLDMENLLGEPGFPDRLQKDHGERASVKIKRNRLCLSVKKKMSFAGARWETDHEPGHDYLLSVEIKCAEKGITLEFHDFSTGKRKIVGGAFLKKGANTASARITHTAGKLKLGIYISTFGNGKAGKAELSGFHLSRIDWSKTKAFSTGVTPNIVINKHGREMYGNVKENEGSVIDEILGELKRIRFGDSKLECVAGRGEDQYFGKHSKAGPDIIYEMDNGRYSPNSTFVIEGKEVIGEPIHGLSGSHRKEGVLLAYGKNVACRRLSNSSIMDLAPTLLRLLGIEKEGFDGNAIEEIAGRRKTESSPSKVSFDTVRDSADKEDENVLLEERLRLLGYID